MYFRVLQKLWATHDRVVDRVVCLHELANKNLIDMVDPAIMFDELRSLHVRYNSMSSKDTTAKVATSSVIGVVRRNMCYHNVVNMKLTP